MSPSNYPADILDSGSRQLDVLEAGETRRAAEVSRLDPIRERADDLKLRILEEGLDDVKAMEAASLTTATLVGELASSRPTARVQSAKALIELLGLKHAGAVAKSEKAKAEMLDAMKRAFESRGIDAGFLGAGD